AVAHRRDRRRRRDLGRRRRRRGDDGGDGERQGDEEAARRHHAYCRRSALRRWTVTAGGAFAATAADAPQRSSPVDGPVPRRGGRTSVRGANVAASPTIGAVRWAKLIARRAQVVAPGTCAAATVNENARLRTRCVFG